MWNRLNTWISFIIKSYINKCIFLIFIYHRFNTGNRTIEMVSVVSSYVPYWAKVIKLIKTSSGSFYQYMNWPQYKPLSMIWYFHLTWNIPNRAMHFYSSQFFLNGAYLLQCGIWYLFFVNTHLYLWPNGVPCDFFVVYSVGQTLYQFHVM